MFNNAALVFLLLFCLLLLVRILLNLKHIQDLEVQVSILEEQVNSLLEISHDVVCHVEDLKSKS